MNYGWQDQLVNETLRKSEFSNASRLQQSHVQTANIAFRLERRVQCTVPRSGRTYSTRKSIFINNPNEIFGQEM